MPDRPEWETVSLEAGDWTTERLRIPGGWLYRTITTRDARRQSAAMVFVPLSDLLGDPGNIKASL